MALVKITDYAARALRRILEQFKGKKSHEDVQRLVARQVQEIENALWDVAELTDINTATFHALDLLGKLVGERRDGAVDADYRLRVRARILANRSCGTHEDIYKVFRALLAGITGYVLKIAPAYPAGFVLTVTGIGITAAQLAIFIRFLRDSKGAAIAAWFGWQPVPDADAFTCSVSCFLSAPTMVGDTSYAVYSTVDFPAAPATFIVDEGLPTEETLTYTAKTSTTLSGFTATQAHDQYANLALVPSPGKGHGDELNAMTGGQLVGMVYV